jgi:hypothetical protein
LVAEAGSRNWNVFVTKRFVTTGCQVRRFVEDSTTRVVPVALLMPKPKRLLVNPGAPGPVEDITAKLAGALMTPANPLLMATE